MKKHITISPGKYFENVIHARIESGRFKNADEVIRNALRLLEAEEQRAPEPKRLVFEEESEFYSGKFDADDFMKSLDL